MFKITKFFQKIMEILTKTQDVSDDNKTKYENLTITFVRKN